MTMPETFLPLTGFTAPQTEPEVLQALLSRVISDTDSGPLALSLIRRFGSLAGTLAAPPSELMSLERLSPDVAAWLQVIKACSVSLLRAKVVERPLLENWNALIDYLTAAMAHDPVEQLRVLFLNPRNFLIADEVQQTGVVNFTPAYPREVLKRALELRATALIIVHNHPSGDPEPSEGDVRMTASIAAAAALVDIALHDHVIVGTRGWRSMRKLGLI